LLLPLPVAMLIYAAGLLPPFMPFYAAMLLIAAITPMLRCRHFTHVIVT